MAKHTLFPCPDPVLGKGVLVQTTLWGNLILGPTARDMHKPEARDMSAASIQEYILSKCMNLVPSFDPKETIHAFCGARAKSDVGDWIIGPSKENERMIHVAGIDSPGLAGAPASEYLIVCVLKLHMAAFSSLVCSFCKSRCGGRQSTPKCRSCSRQKSFVQSQASSNHYS